MFTELAIGSGIPKEKIGRGNRHLAKAHHSSFISQPIDVSFSRAVLIEVFSYPSELGINRSRLCQPTRTKTSVSEYSITIASITTKYRPIGLLKANVALTDAVVIDVID